MAEFTPNESQKKAIETKGANILVSAAAGSGKTTVLVERVIKMVIQDRVNIDSLIIVTFTKAAAASMKSKIYSRIRKAIREGNLDNDTKEHLKKQLIKIYNAKISTIDSLCLDIVKENFQYIDLDPGFRIADEGELALIKSDVLSELLEDHYENPDDDFLEFVSYYTDKNDSKIEGLINQLLDFAESHPEPERFLQRAVLSYENAAHQEFDIEKPENKWVTSYANIITEKTVKMLNMCKKGEEICVAVDGPLKYLNNFETIEPALGRIVSGPFDFKRHEIESLLSDWPKLASGSNKNIDEKLLNKAKELYKGINDILKELLEKYLYQNLDVMYQDMGNCVKVVKELVSLVLEYRERLRVVKKEKNIASFNDVAHFAIDVLIESFDEDGNASYSPVADNYAKATSEVIVDEYQDTNRLQDELVKALGAERFGRPDIFMVGDVKQSIYGFRMACPELFQDKYDKYQDMENCQLIVLGENYRSRKEILDFSNFIFNQIMVPSVGIVDYTDNHELKAGLSPDEKEIIPEIILINGGGEQGRVAEAYEIARKIENLVATGEYKYKDIAILSRTTSNPQIEKVLSERNIPVIKSSSTGFFSALEVGLCLNLLRIIDNPYQDIAFTAVLTSPIVGLNANDLAKIKTNFTGEKFSIFGGIKEYAKEDDKTQSFLEKFNQWREKSDYFGISKFIDFVLDDSGLYNIVSAMPSGESRRANLDLLKSLSVDFSNTSYTGLFNFIRYIEELVKNNKDFGQAQVISDDFDAVSMMTIHKSKGLEFPVVILARSAKVFNMQDVRGAVVLDNDLGVGLEVRDVENKIKRKTMIMETIIEKKKRDSWAEEIRLLYVALTRAQEKLIITGSDGQLKGKIEAWNIDLEEPESARQLDADLILSDSGYMKLLGDCMVNTGNAKFTWDIKNIEDIATDRVLEVVNTEAMKEYLESLCSYSASHEGGTSEMFSYVYLYQEATNTLLKKTASSLETAFDDERNREKTEDDSQVKFSNSVNLGSERGTAYHKFFELLDYSNPDINGQLAKLKEEGLLSEEQEKLINIKDFESFLISDLGQRMRGAFESGKLVREQQFVMGITENGELRLIQGIIDAFFEEDDGIVLVDYKTDRKRSEEWLKETYLGQQQAYKMAIEGAKGKQVKEMVLYSTDLAKAILIG